MVTKLIDKSMFTKARIKLTAYYLVIIMFVSFLFSLLAYRGFVYEIWRGLRLQGDNLPRSVLKSIQEEVKNDPAPFGIFYGPARLGQIINQEIYEEARRRVLINLFYINMAVLITAGVGGYILAGITLQPIEKVMEEQKRFVSDASHELRTPITSLKTEIEVALRDDKLNISEAKNILKSNLEEVNKMQDLASYLLTLSRYEKDTKNNFESVNLSELVQKSIRQHLKEIHKKKITLRTNIADTYIKARPIAVAELTSILLDNAIKYTNTGGKIEIILSKTARSIKLEVVDTGVGISEQDLPHIFDRFYRADQSRNKKNVDGFGLGLSIAKKIAELHSATIDVKSKLGVGTKFVVRFPRHF